MDRSQYLDWGRAAISYVKRNVRYRGLNTPGGWIRNPYPWDTGAKFVARFESNSGFAKLREELQKKGLGYGEEYINGLDKLAKQTQTGNCSDLSAVAFNFLKTQRITPIDYFGVFRGSWDHAFVILGRDPSIPLANFADWSHEAVLVDPLYDRSDIAGMLALWYPRALPFVDADVMYRVE